MKGKMLKLTLSRETLRSLNPVELAAAAGANTTNPGSSIAVPCGVQPTLHGTCPINSCGAFCTVFC